MISEWMKVMLGEISRKQAEAEQVRIEERRRRNEHGRRDAQERGDAHGHRDAHGQDAPGVAPRPGEERARG